MRDDTIEYEELADLIHEYNATVQNNAYEYRKFREDYGDTNEEVSSAYYDLAQDFYNDISGDDDASSMMSDLNLEIQGDSMMEQADETLEDSKIYQLTYEQAEKSLVVTAQTAQNQISQLENSIQETKETLFVLLGWNYNDNPVIGELPEVDLNRIEEMNLDQDLETAIANNYTLQINKRQLENSRNQTTKESLQTAISNNERQIGHPFPALISPSVRPEPLMSRPRFRLPWKRRIPGWRLSSLRRG